jgi:excisionase family DNA binding protein
MSDGDFLTIDDIVAELGLTYPQVYRRLRRGVIPATRGGQNGLQWLVHRNDLKAYVEAGQPLTPPPRPGLLLSVPQVAAMTGMTSNRVRQLCQMGRFEVRRGPHENSHIRILRSSVDAYMRLNGKSL